VSEHATDRDEAGAAAQADGAGSARPTDRAGGAVLQPSAISSFPARVLRPAQLPSIDRGAGARTTPLVTLDAGATSFLNGITRFEPGASIGHHLHNCAESVIILEGEAVLDVDGVEHRLRRFDTSLVPANVPHRFRNASASEPMAIFWSYGSVDATRTLLGTGITARIDAEQRGRFGEPRQGEPAVGGASGPVLEVVELTVRPEAIQAFEDAITRAAELFQRAPGCRSFELVRSVEQAEQYRLLIVWTALEDHTVGFRGSADFAAWRELVTPHLAQPPAAVHLRHVLKGF